MPLHDFRSVFFPYCLVKNDDGHYVVLNREYKPVGFGTSDWVKYERYPVTYKIKGLTAARLAKISAKGDANKDRIYLYNDGCVPTHSAKDMKAYLDRLKVLAPLLVELQPTK